MGLLQRVGWLPVVEEGEEVVGTLGDWFPLDESDRGLRPRRWHL